MKNLVKVRILALAAIMATGTIAFGQGANSVTVLPTQLPAGASVNLSDGDHHFVQVITIDLFTDAAANNIVITFPPEITIADVDLSGGAISDEIYFTTDATNALVPSYTSYVADVLTIGLGAVAIVDHDLISIIVPVEVDATPVTDLTYSVVVDGGAAVTANVDIVSGPLSVMSFDDDATGEGLIDLATTGSQYANIRGKFHPNTVAAHGNFLSANSLNMLDEEGLGIGIVAAAAPGDPWLSTWDAASVADNDGEITYSVWASQDRSLLRSDLGSGAIPVNDYLTETDLTAYEGVSLAGLIDLTLLNPDGYWFFYLTSSATADWFLASSDSMFVSHAPALIDPLTDLVASGVGTAVNDGSGKGVGVDFDNDDVFDNTDGGGDDIATLSMTLDGGTVLDRNGVVVLPGVDNVDIFWFVDDVNGDARVHVFLVADTATYDSSDVTISNGVVSSFGNGVGLGTEITTTAYYEDDDTNWVNLSVTTPSVIAANTTYYIYVVLYDGTYKTVELVREVNTAAAEDPVVFTVTHFPRLVFHDLLLAPSTDWDTGLDQYLPISWGETFDGDKDLDAGGTATIILYAVDALSYGWDNATYTGIIDDGGGGDVSDPDNPIAGLVGTAAYIITEITDNADSREDNRYMWDIRASGIPDGTYHIWGTMEDGNDVITMQLNSVPALMDGVAIDDRAIVVRHGQNFLANSPFEGEAVELSQDDVYEFTWQEATSSNSNAGEVKILLVPENVAPSAIEYLSAANGVTGPTNISGPVFTPAAALTELNDITLDVAAYTGLEPALYRAVITTAAGQDLFDWYRNGELVATGVTLLAGSNALSEGVAFTAGAITGHTLNSAWEFYAFPTAGDLTAAGKGGYYWIVPTLDGTAVDGDTPEADTDGFPGSTNKAQLTVSYLVEDYGTAPGATRDPATVAAADVSFNYYDVYYFYAPDGSLDGLDGAVGYTNDVGSANDLDDIVVVSTYAGSTPHNYRVVIDAELANDTYDVYQDGVLIADATAINAGTPVDFGNGISIDFVANTGHGLDDAWTFRVDGHVATKADGQLYFNGEGGSGLNYRVVSSSVAAQEGDTLDLTLQVTYNSGGAGQKVALLKVYLDLPTDNLSIVGETDTVFAAVPASGFVPFVNGYSPAAGYQSLEFEAYLTGGKQWGGGGDYADNEWVDIGTFQVEVTGSYSGAGLSHNIILFNESTAMADDNLDPLSVLVLANAVDVQLYRRGSIAGLVEIEGRTEETEQVNVFVAKSGSYDPIDDALFLSSNGNDPDATDGIQVVLDAGGAFTLYDVPTGQYDVYVTRPGWLSQKQDGITVQPTSSSSVNFQNADKLLGGDVAGYLETDGKDYPDNQIYTEDETVLVGLLGTSPAAVPESYADLTGDGFVGIEDLTIVVKNVGAVTKKGEGLLYKELDIRGTNENALVALIAPDMESTEATFVIQARDLVSLRGFAAELVINSDHWDLASFESGLSSFGDARSYQRLEGDYITFYSASAEWDGLFEEEMTLAFITLISKVADPEAPSLEAVTLVDHNFSGIDAVIDDTGGIPTEFSLSQNFPNPFNPVTTINFALPDAGKVRLAVYNLLGQEVHSLISGNMDAGSYKAVWNSMDNTGRKVSSGVYFYRLMVDGKIVNTRKMLLLK